MAPIMERSGSSSEIHVHCRAVLFIVNCWGNALCCRLCTVFYLNEFKIFKCFRPSCSLGVSTYPQKNLGHSPYKVPFLFYETWFCCHTICIMYSRGLTLFYITNVIALWYEPVIYGSGSPKVHQGIIGIIYFRGLTSFSMVNVVVLWFESYI
jgi:hypothetical protein